jgi:hypothetical protein
VCALWVRSLGVESFSPRVTSVGPFGISVAGGQVQVSRWPSGQRAFSWVFITPISSPTLAELCPSHALGFGFATPSQFDNRYRVVIPCWFLVLLCSVLPTSWFLGYLKAKRLQGVGRCPSCGYDLRATPDQCPECGTVKGAA